MDRDLARAFAPLLTQTIILAPYDHQNIYGEDIYNDEVTVKCRISGMIDFDHTVEGQTIKAKHKIYIERLDYDVDVKDRITMPDGFQPLHPPILGIAQRPDETGDFLTVIYV